MFYFEQLLTQGLAGIDRTAIVPTVIGIAYAILLVGFLVGLYHAALRGGDLQSLALTAIKYLVIAIILANWSSAFREVNSSFNQVAHYIDNASGVGDMFLSWWDQLKQQFGTGVTSAILPAIAGGWAAISAALAVTVAYLVYAVMVVAFAFFYVLYGCVLYVLGPLVLALLPMPGVGQLAKSYATNLMIWNVWGVLYATFGSLITAIQFGRIGDVANQGFLTGFFKGSSQTAILGLVSIFYSLALGVIPFIAKRLISGDVGATAYALLKTAAIATGAAVSAVAGVGVGFGAEAGVAGGTGGSSSAAGAGGGVGAGIASSSTAPPEPSLAGTIRSGLESVAADGTAPQQPSGGSGEMELVPAGASSGSTGGESNGDGSTRTAHAASPQSGAVQRTPYRSSSLTNAAAFHVGRFAGRSARSLVKSNGSKDKDEEG